MIDEQTDSSSTSQETNSNVFQQKNTSTSENQTNPEQVLTQLKQEEESIIFQNTCQTEAHELIRQRLETLTLLQNQIKQLETQKNIFISLLQQLSNIHESDLLNIQQNSFQQVKKIFKETKYQLMENQKKSSTQPISLPINTKELIKISLFISLPLIIAIAIAVSLIIFELHHLFG